MNLEQLSAALRGVFPAIITPMTPEGDIDHVGIAGNMEKLSTLGLSGILALGSTGEQPHLSEFDRALVLESARRHLPEQMVLIAGTGLNGTRTTIEETQRAALFGADVALVVTPTYYQRAMNAAALIDHYRAVADASPIPIMLYSVPGITAITLPPQAVGVLAEHPNIIGMKNSSSDMALAVQYQDAAGNDFIILAGSPHAAPAALVSGLVHGVILAAANVCPEAAVALMAAARMEDLAGVRAAARTLYTVADGVGKFGIAGWKAGAELRGYSAGKVRAPLRNLEASEYLEIRQVIEAL